MNILFVYYLPSGGMETLARQRHAALKQHGVNFHFLYFQSGSGVQNITGIPIFITKSDLEIRKILLDGNYDYIIVGADHLFVKRLRQMKYKGKIIYEVQGLGDKIIAQNWLRNAAPFIEKYADGILFPRTPHLINFIDSYYPNTKKFCFDNCIDTSIFQYKKNSSPNNPVIGWVGRIEENKNWKDFLDICYTLHQINPNMKIWMFEDNTLTAKSERLNFQTKLHSLQLVKHLSLFNNISHHKMPEYFSMIGDSGGFLCSTSKVEGFGYAVVEAMSCRCPVLASDSDGIKASIIHNETGKIYPHHNISKAVQEAKELMTNQELRKNIINNALNLVQKKFTLTTYANNFMDMIKSLKNK
ncbi:glycosyltransferase involved in cell wall biosynthesis [Scopulibacillus darangshiensis]|uniref:Glycosyltransferase involved in cell wall biosynthesis n=1 Tax=Scopulibacillus darangshiensis TaxID=442528 RepID=A0A4R2NQ35_9BACL|nr:glycosyltransferase family 4 protein [Scopulibacillus darangshiensis]TCP23792.1 glycosyltransferase involved in cell wall biosynthesis [Scopulibacillus darangshiensis]